MAHAHDVEELLAKLKRDDARILDEMLDGGGVDFLEKEPKVSMYKISLDDYRVAEKSCGIQQFGLPKTSTLRINAFRLSQNIKFGNLILAIIVYNVFAMAVATDERMASGEDFLFFPAPFAKVYAVNDLVITSIFTFEVAVGMIAHGISIGRHSFLQYNQWNKLDFLVVVTAWLHILNIGAGRFGFLRALRVLRVFKALKHPAFSGIRKIINLLGQSLELLKNVLLLSFFAFYLFAVFGLNMFMGRLRASCEGEPASSDLTGDLSCQDYFQINSSSVGVDTHVLCPAGCAFTTGAVQELCGVRGQCYANFDNIVWAVLTVFRSVTMEGWSDICYVLMSVVDPDWEWAVVLYFFCLLMFVTNLVVNLFVAVICTQFAGTKISRQGHQDLLKLRRLRGLWLQHDRTGDGVLRTAVLRRILRQVMNQDEKVDAAITRMTAARQQKQDKERGGTNAVAQSLKDGTCANSGWRFDELLAFVRGDLRPAATEDNEPKKEGCFARFINWLETLTGIDIDGDGDVGVVGTTSMPELSGEDVFILDAEMREQQMIEDRAELLKDGKHCVKIQRVSLDVVKTTAFSHFILFCVVLNTFFLALEHHGQSNDWALMLLFIENLFLVIFTIEMIMKWLAFGVKAYFAFNANRFDFVLVTLSLVEQVAMLAGTHGALGSVTVLRSLRLLRVFRAMRHMTGLRRQLQTMKQSSTDVWSNFILVMFILVIFSLLGMQLFSNDAGIGFSVRFGQNFDTFWSSMLLLFQVLTGENWVELLEMGMARSTFAPAALFVGYYIIVVYVLLNIFIALIMDNFEMEDDKKRSDQAEQFLREFMERRKTELQIENGETSSKRIKKKKKTSKLLHSFIDERAYIDTRNHIQELAAAQSVPDEPGSAPLTAGRLGEDEEHAEFHQSLVKVARLADNIEEYDKYLNLPVDEPAESRAKKDAMKKVLQDVGVQRCLLSMRRAQKASAAWIMQTTCPIPFSKHKFNVFDFVLTVTIAVNCVLLAMDRPTLDPESTTARTIVAADAVFLVIFSAECVIKISATGLVSPGGYLRDTWNLMDLLLLGLMYVDLLFNSFQGNPGRTLRPLRALRPLRMINRNESMKLVLDLFFRSLPQIAEVVVLLLAFFLLMAILGTNLFAGQLYRCNDGAVFGKFDCVGTFTCDPRIQECPGVQGEIQLRDWDVPISNFDDVLKSLSTLIEVATLEGWVDVMHNTMDTAPQIDLQPSKDNSPYSCLFFVFFIAVGTFFVMNLVIAVYIDSFNQSRGTGLLTNEQVGWVELKRTMHGIKPRRVRQIPQRGFRRQLYILVTATAWSDCTNAKRLSDDDIVERELTVPALQPPLFESAMSIVILLNTATLSMVWVDQSQAWQDAVEYMEYAFVIVYCLEAAVKILGLGSRVYFRAHWNKFDFAIVVFSIMGVVKSISKHLDTSVMQTTRLLRMAKLVRRVQGLRALVNTLFMSLPAILNLASLLVIVFYVYAVMGVQLFCGAPFQDNLSEDANFENFLVAMFLLLRVTTGENWNGIMHDLEVSGACDTEQDPPCPQFWAARTYFLSFYIIAAFVFMKLFIAVILDNFASSFNKEDSAVDPSHLADYRKKWYSLDREGKGIIPTKQLRPFIRALRRPLGQSTWTRRAMEEVCTEAIEHSNASIDPSDGMLHTREEFVAKYRDGAEKEWGRADRLADKGGAPTDWQRVDPSTGKLSTREEFRAKYLDGGIVEWERGQVVKFHELLLVLSVRCVGLSALEYRERVHRFYSQSKTQQAVAATFIKAAFRGRVVRRLTVSNGKPIEAPPHHPSAPSALGVSKAAAPEPELTSQVGHRQFSNPTTTRPIVSRTLSSKVVHNPLAAIEKEHAREPERALPAVQALALAEAMSRFARELGKGIVQQQQQQQPQQQQQQQRQRQRQRQRQQWAEATGVVRAEPPVRLYGAGKGYDDV